MKDQVRAQAATLLTELIADNMTVALSWGHALQAMVYATEVSRDYSLRPTPLVGELSSISNEITEGELSANSPPGSARNGPPCTPRRPSPARSRARAALRAVDRKTLQLARSADLVFVGIDTPSHGSSSAILTSLQLSTLEKKDFWAAEPVGDLAARYYDAEGREMQGRSPTEYWPSTSTTCAGSPTSWA